MRKFIYPVVLVIAYFVAFAYFFVNSGAGHDWGSVAVFLMNLPLGLISLGWDHLSGTRGFSFPPLVALGLLQYIMIGYFIGRWQDRRALKRKAGKTSDPFSSSTRLP